LRGFSAGAELGGVSVYLSEMAPPTQKGFSVAWQSASQQVAIIVAAVIGYVLNKLLTPPEIRDWGWRIPFFVGCLIVPFIFVNRGCNMDTPTPLEQCGVRGVTGGCTFMGPARVYARMAGDDGLVDHSRHEEGPGRGRRVARFRQQ
jgi:MFS family permease